MPLDVIRLLDSDLFAMTTGEEFKAALALWCKSWTQVPAGSLPDDDRVLAHLSSTGARWKKVKEQALRNWVKCSDGRLYHPTVCEKALEALPFRHAHEAKKTAEAERKQRERDDRRALFERLRLAGRVVDYNTPTKALRAMVGDLPPLEVTQAVTPVTPESVTPVTPFTPSVTAKTGTGTGTGTGTDYSSSLRSEPVGHSSDRDVTSVLDAESSGRALVLTAQPAEKPKKPIKAKPDNVTADEQSQFEAWWRVYPHKVSKQDALLAFVNVLRFSHVDPVFLAERAQLYGQWLNRTGTLPANGATWLNGQRWEDDLDFTPRQSQQPRGQWSSMDDAIGSMNFEE